MKKLLIAVAAVLTAAVSYGQGQVNFNNVFAPNGAIWDVDLTDVRGPGAGVVAGLFLASDLTTPLGTTTFFTDAGAEHLLNPVDITIPGIASGETASFVVRVWSEGFAGFEASRDGFGKFGESDAFDNAVGGGLVTPANTIFEGFTLQQIPEPSTIALGLIGAGALLLRRRRK